MSSDKLPQFAAFQSSGDLIADRRAGYARDLARRGDFAAAIDLMRQALELAPGHTPFLLRLAEWLERIGNRDGAVAALRDALVADPHDRHGAALKLALLGETQTPQAPPAAYVAGLFDAYAPRFDSALVERLGYRAPDLLWRALCAVSGGTSPAYRHALDLGCGTGLMGERLRRAVSFLEGVDLSAGMLREAEVKGVYDRLRHGDAFATTEAVPAHADLAVAADVFCYLGDLSAPLLAVASVLEGGGLFAFTVEAAPDDAGFLLRSSLRYAHGRAFVERQLAAAGFSILHFETTELRRDRGEAVLGHVVVARLGLAYAQSAVERALILSALAKELAPNAIPGRDAEPALPVPPLQ